MRHHVHRFELRHKPAKVYDCSQHNARYPFNDSMPITFGGSLKDIVGQTSTEYDFVRGLQHSTKKEQAIGPSYRSSKRLESEA